MQEFIVLMKRNPMGEYVPEIVDFHDLRAFNESLDWVDGVPNEMVKLEREEYAALVYVESERSLTMSESEGFAYDAEYEIQKLRGKQAKAS